MVLKYKIARNKDKLEFVKMKNDFFKYFLESTGEKRNYSDNKWELEFEDIMKKKNTFIYFIFYERNIVGYMIIILETTGENKYGYLEDIFIKEEFRGKGFGKKAIKYFIKLSKDRNLKKLGVGTRIENKRAIKIYEDLGFQIKGLNFGLDLD